MRVMAIVGSLMLFITSGPAYAAKVTGKVVITEGFREALAKQEREQGEAGREYYWKQPNGIIAVSLPRVDPASDIAVLLFKEGAKAPGPDELATVKVHTGGMEKNVVVTRPGSTLKFRNVDPYDHELYSPEMESFKPEHQSNGAFRPIEFAKEGVYQVRCKLIPHFLGYVVVTSASSVLQVKRDGTIGPLELEPGKYSVKVFHGGKWVHDKSMVVSGRTASIQVKLSKESFAAGKAGKEKKTDKAASKSE